MDGNFLGRYETKIQEWETMIQNDPDNEDRYQDEMYTYMAACVPYIQMFTSESSDRHTIDTVFGASKKKGVQPAVFIADAAVAAVRSAPQEAPPVLVDVWGEGAQSPVVVSPESWDEITAPDQKPSPESGLWRIHE